MEIFEFSVTARGDDGVYYLKIEGNAFGVFVIVVLWFPVGSQESWKSMWIGKRLSFARVGCKIELLALHLQDFWQLFIFISFRLSLNSAPWRV